jgi:hypothetical protein
VRLPAGKSRPNLTGELAPSGKIPLELKRNDPTFEVFCRHMDLRARFPQALATQSEAKTKPTQRVAGKAVSFGWALAISYPANRFHKGP